MIVEELWSARDEADLAAFREALRRGDLAGALFALESAPPAVASADRALLLRWAEEVAARLPVPASPVAQCEALAEVLAGENDLRGSPVAFQHAWSSQLHQVLSRRRGLPILLAAVWMEVGRMAGLEMSGIGLPGHFLVRVGGRHGVYADPFSGGRILSVAECRRIVRRISGGRVPWHASYLAPRSLPQIAERVLNNLVRSYESSQSWAELYRTLSFLMAVRPDAASPLLQRGLASLRLGALQWAQRDLDEVQRRFPGSQEAAAAAAQGGALRGSLPH